MEKKDSKGFLLTLIAIAIFAASVATATYIALTKLKKRREIKEIERYLDCVIE